MKVSIGIPFYNPGDVFKHSIFSILNQTFTDFELILVDDGSSDNSLAIAESIDDPRVRVISDGENKGLPYRLNQIIDLSNGDFIARMDADDFSAPDRIEKQLALLNSLDDIDIVSTGMCSITDDNEVIGYRVPLQASSKDLSVTDALFGRSGIAHATILARRSWYRRNRYNEKAKLKEDYQLWVDAAIKHDLKVAYIKKPLYFYREESSVSPQKAVRAYYFGLKIIIFQYFSHLSLKNKIKIVMLNLLKICYVTFATLTRSSDKVLARRNKGTEQNPQLVKKLQEDVDQLIAECELNE